MGDKGTSKKITKVKGGGTSSASSGKAFTPTEEAKSSAFKFRLFAALAWAGAIGFEVWAIILLRKPPISMPWLIGLIVADLILVVIGSLLWKKANRFDPASEQDKVKFFIQNQLGVIIAIIAFLPLVVLIFMNKDMDGKQKGIVGGIAVAALLLAGIAGVDFNPPSQEQYAEQTAQVEALMGKNSVFWTKSGTRYHLYSDCRYINTKKTDEIFNGTLAQARELKNISILCSDCEKRAEKAKPLSVADKVKDAIVDTVESVDAEKEEVE